MNNKVLWALGAVVVLMFVVGLGLPRLVDKVADRVIIKLQKDYSPSPYGPGFDPDKIDSDKLKKKN